MVDVPLHWYSPRLKHSSQRSPSSTWLSDDDVCDGLLVEAEVGAESAVVDAELGALPAVDVTAGVASVVGSEEAPPMALLMAPMMRSKLATRPVSP